MCGSHRPGVFTTWGERQHRINHKSCSNLFACSSKAVGCLCQLRVGIWYFLMIPLHHPELWCSKTRWTREPKIKTAHNTPFFKILRWCGPLCSARNRRKIFIEKPWALMVLGATIHHSMLRQLRLHSFSRYFCYYNSIPISTLAFFSPKQCVHTEGFLWQELRPVLDQGHFTWEFWRKMAPVTCPCPCRLRRLAQNAAKNCRIKWLFWHVHMHFDCAGSHKTLVPALARFAWEFLCKIALLTCPYAFQLRRLERSLPRKFCLLLVCGILPENSRIKWLLWLVQVRFDHAGSRKTQA